MSNTHYTPAVGQKFHSDGSVRPFPGNTIICFVDPQSHAYREVVWVQEHLKAQPFAQKFALLPPSSLHMTVIQLICDEVRQLEAWSSLLPLDAPLITTDLFFHEKIQAVSAPAGFKMRFKRLARSPQGLSLGLEPADESTHETIWQYRDAIAAATGVRFPDHETYEFHISIAYQIVQLDDVEEKQYRDYAETVDTRLKQSFGIFSTGRPVLTFFDDMFAFVPFDQRDALVSRRAGEG